MDASVDSHLWSSIDFKFDEELNPSDLKLPYALKLWQTTYNLPGTALTSLLKVLYTFAPNTLDERVAASKYRFQKALGISAQNDVLLFDKKAYCPTCSSVFHFDECHSGNFVNTCPTRRFKDHVQVSLRGSCGTDLGEMVQIPNAPKGRLHFKPRIVFPTGSVRERIAEFYARPSFRAQCERHRHRQAVSDPFLGDIPDQSASLWRDIYDGNIWKSFSIPATATDETHDDMSSFLTHPDHLAFMLTVDW